MDQEPQPVTDTAANDQPAEDERTGSIAAAYQVRLTLRDRQNVLKEDIPTNAAIEGLIEAAIVSQYPAFSVTARSERTDK